jgi:ribosomal protein S17E
LRDSSSDALKTAAEEVYKDFIKNKPSVVKLLEMSYRPLVDQKILARFELSQDDSAPAQVYRQIIPHIKCVFDTNFMLRALTDYSPWCGVHFETLQLLNELNIERVIFGHTLEELLYAIRHTVKQDISATPRNTKKFSMNTSISPFGLEFFDTRNFRSISSYLELVEERMHNILKNFRIKVMPTQDLNLDQKEVHDLASCFDRNFHKNPLAAVHDARSILAVKALNKRNGPVFVKIDDFELPITYFPVKLVTCDIACLLVAFPNETADPLKLIYELDDAHAVLCQQPIYQRLTQLLSDDFDRVTRIGHYVLNSLNLKVREKVAGYTDFHENRSWLTRICFGFDDFFCEE